LPWWSRWENGQLISPALTMKMALDFKIGIFTCVE
jgi:hypothetical protein